MAANDTMILTVLTPEKTLMEVGVSKVSLPGSKGRFMVLKDHAPIISSLSEGDLVYTSDNVYFADFSDDSFFGNDCLCEYLYVYCLKLIESGGAEYALSASPTDPRCRPCHRGGSSF